MCIHRQNTTIFVSSKLVVYYIRHNYMFRPLMLAIFTLYMDLSSGYTTYVWCFLGCGEKVFFCRTESLFVSVVGERYGTVSLLSMSWFSCVKNGVPCIILVPLVIQWYLCARSRMLCYCFYSSSVSLRKS
jgi:hypothetical protein